MPRSWRIRTCKLTSRLVPTRLYILRRDAEQLQLVLVPEIKTDGIKPDGSFGQHAGLLYTYARSKPPPPSQTNMIDSGNYGKDFANNVMALEIEAGGTEFAANETGIDAFETFWEGSQWMVVYNTLTGVLHWDLVRTCRCLRKGETVLIMCMR